MNRVLARFLVLYFLLAPQPSYAFYTYCVRALKSVVNAAAEHVPVTGIVPYVIPHVVSEEGTSRSGGVYRVDIRERKSDGKQVTHRYPIKEDELAWGSLIHQDRLLKRFRKINKTLPLPRSYGIKRGLNGQRVWESDYIKGESGLNTLKKIMSDPQMKNDVKFLEGLKLFRKALVALQEFHAAGGLHLDAKSANFVLTPEGRVVLIDLAGSVYRNSQNKGKSILPTAIHYEADYLPPEVNMFKIKMKDLLTIPNSFDFYTMAKSFQAKFFLGLRVEDYMLNRKDPDKAKMIDIYARYKTEILDVITNRDPAVRETFKMDSLDSLIASLEAATLP